MTEQVAEEVKPEEVVVETTKPKRQKVEKPKPVAFTWNLQAYTFMEAVKAIDSIINYGAKTTEASDIIFEVGEDGITLRQMDSSRVSMVDFALTKQGFNEYALTNGGKVCFNSKDILAVLDGVKPDRLDKDGALKTEGEKLLLNLENGVDLKLDIQHSEYNRTFTLKAFEPEKGEETPPIPQVEFKAVFKIEKDLLLKILNDAEKASTEHVTIVAEENDVIFKSASDATARKFETTLPKTDRHRLLDLQIKESAKATYNLDLLKTMIENTPKDTTAITASFSTDMPILVETGQFERLNMYLAPKVDVE